MRFGGSTAQLIAIKGWAERFEAVWIAFAAMSLPVPDAPCDRTDDTSLSATRDARRNVSLITGECPTIWSNPKPSVLEMNGDTVLLSDGESISVVFTLLASVFIVRTSAASVN